MARKTKNKLAKARAEADPPFELTYPIADLAKLKLPWSLKDRADFINNHMSVCEITKSGIAIAVRWRLGLERIECVPVALDNIYQHGETQGPRQYELDFAMQGKSPGPLAKTHLQWLYDKALEFGATPEAVRLFKCVRDVPKKDEEEMAEKLKGKAKAEKAPKAAKADKPVGGGGKVAKGGNKGNPEALEKAREASAARNAEAQKAKIGLNVTAKELGTDKAKLRGGRLEKLRYVIAQKPKTVGDIVGSTFKGEDGEEYTIDMGALRGMEKRGHITIG